MSARRLAAILLCLCFALPLALAQNAPPNLSSHLQNLPADAGPVRIKILLDGTRPLAEVTAALTRAGASIDRAASSSDLTASALPGQLATLAQTPGVQAVLPMRSPHGPVSGHTLHSLAHSLAANGHAPAQAAAPLGIIGAYAAAHNGAGVTIGVISDSFNVCSTCLTTAADDISTANLPGPGNSAGDITPVLVVSEGSVNPADGSTDEGRALIQVIYGLAPKAHFCFAAGGFTQSTFVAAIQSLYGTSSTCHANIILDDLTFDDEPFFSDSMISAAVDQATAAGIAYVSAAGNTGPALYDATFAPVSDAAARASSSGNLKLAQVPASLTGGGFQNFSGTSTPQVAFAIGVPSADAFLNFQWDDPFVLGKITADYNLLVFDAAGNYLPNLSGTDDNFSTGQAVEFVNLPVATTSYQLAISRTSASNASPANHLRIVLEGATFAQVALTGLPAPTAPSIFGHVAAAGAITSSAYNFSDLSAPERFNSPGPFTVVFDSAGNRLSTPITRLKPVVAGLDRLDTTFLFPGYDPDNDGFPNFYGTSAASATVTAVAALDLQASNFTATPAQIASALIGSASHPSTYNPVDGYGFINAPKSTTLASGGTLTQAASTSSLTSSQNPSFAGSNVAFTATVTSTGTAPAGSVTFFDGTTSLGSTQLDASQHATFATSALAAGSHTITATYSGDSSHAASTSAALMQVVSSVTPVVSGFPSPDHVTASHTFTVTITNGAGTTITGYIGTIIFSSSDPQATLPRAYTFQGSDNGTHTFAASLNSGGTYSITACAANACGTQSGITVDDFVWLVNSNGTLSRLDETGANVTSSVGSAHTPATQGAVAIDQFGAVWAVTSSANALLHTDKSAANSAIYTNAGINTPVSLAIDGLGEVWVADGNNGISVFSNGGAVVSYPAPYQTGSSTRPSALAAPTGLAIDRSGSVWITNSGNATVTKVIGVASPVVTPTATGVANHTLGVRP